MKLGGQLIVGDLLIDEFTIVLQFAVEVDTAVIAAHGHRLAVAHRSLLAGRKVAERRVLV